MLMTSCSDDSGSSTIEPIKNSANEVISITFIIDTVETAAQIATNEITILFPALSDVTALVPTFQISSRATISPASGVAQDFSNPVTYTVTAEDGSQQLYTVNVQVEAASTDTSISIFKFENLAEGQASYDEINKVATDIDTLIHYVPYLSPVKALKSLIFLPNGATITPESGETLDYTQPVKYTVTAQNGATKDYLVFVENRLNPLKIGLFDSEIFKDKKPKDLITFTVNEINPILDSIQVNLYDRIAKTTVPLSVKETAETTNGNYSITAQLPDNYTNGLYKLDVSIEHDNSDSSDGFILFKGIPNFVKVNPNFLNINGVSQDVTVTNLLSPQGFFDAEMYIDKERFDAYTFYLQQNGVDYKLPTDGHDTHFAEVRFSMMDDLAAQGGITGTDYKIVIAVDGQRYEFPFINHLQAPIQVVATDTPVITNIDKMTVVKGQTITVSGTDLFYDTTLIGHGEPASTYLELQNDSNSNIRYSIEQKEGTSDQITFTIPDTFQSGTYKVTLLNSLGVTTDPNAPEILLTIVQAASEHPSITVAEAIIYLDSSSFLYKQVRVSFSENIEGVDFEDFTLGAGAITIGNFQITPSSVLTNRLSDEVVNRITNYSDGSITVDGYKIPFTVSIRN